MPPEISNYIALYGYLAIFILVLSQEIGIPNPVPNELVLIFSGYLSFKGILYLPFVILTALTADFTGTNLLYFTFYLFGTYILKHKPRWIPISEKTITKYSSRISQGGIWSIYIGRLTPFLRGYTSAITGLLQIKPKVFLPVAVITALVWSCLCVGAGSLLAPVWIKTGIKITHPQYFFVGLLVLMLSIAAGKIIIENHKSVKQNKQHG